MELVMSKRISFMKRFITLLGLSFLLSACSSVQLGKPFQSVQTVTPEKGLLYIYSDYDLIIGGKYYIGVEDLSRSGEILINDIAVGLLRGEDYMAFQCDPGPVTVSAGFGEDLSSTAVDVEPGGVYYVKVERALFYRGLWEYYTPKQVTAVEALERLKECTFKEPGITLADKRWTKVTPEVNLDKLKTVYVDTSLGEECASCPYIIEDFQARNYSVDSGVTNAMPAGTQCLVKAKEEWFWDVTTYLLALEIELINPETHNVYASGKVRRALPQGRRGPKVMVAEILNAMFHKSDMPVGVEVLRN